ncbi:pentatricopeptide repeat-containing protein At4g01400, mitochondrial [Syzygium oleosum]|uniref:pentatricopeptide repeat-containing protein At4g01400, mitochondrial n=1 Tax=Syzygium oleosum TaxID=219896 RepID=UPI0011D2BA5B|nr:pentatricopeptide repeat-containing protein At4g01400, mitochondrial [Syzygium oleosum]XP_030459108.2 pentatricopeptide repeat-containing protein At4g01400, mitochondrial [Syzygium oleosum]XP_030459124.1 pentatricopeptide repeat-containing protein At4g01400, mitochondrial [Syzygium oleosum]XP_056169852.1 pentatricopeptide repeat-containing protein At4g01400, mitochondrial [Syzygium oleosum]XP_056169863.1 pentatricopeptide repeat-containing protein At4g01400, mitochondrial [Syzygium oleosum]
MFFSLRDTMIEKVFMRRPLHGLSKSSTLPLSFILWRNPLVHFSSSESSDPQSQMRNREQERSSSGYFIGSPARVQKLIASQSDPLLAKEIFDFASRQPDFCLSYASFQILILKLARAKQFTLVDDVIICLKSSCHSITPSLFLNLIKIYADADIPDKALKIFYTMLEFNCKPSPKHLNHILEALVSHRNYIRPAFDLFKIAHRHGVLPNTKSYNILMRAFCLNGDLSIAYSLFNQMFKRDLFPDVESYRILMQGLCRKSQVNTAVDLLEDMLNKGFVPDALSYTTLLNALCRRKKLREAYKLLCRMKVKGCNPDIVHYNTVILGFCREGRAADACKILEDMPSNGCMPNLVSYRTLVGGLCDQGMHDEAKTYVVEMVSKGFSPHVSVSHGLIKGFCNVGKIEEACGVVELLLKNGEAPHSDTWLIILDMICEENDKVRTQNALQDLLRIEITRHTRIVDAAAYLEGYVIGKIRAKSRRR